MLPLTPRPPRYESDDTGSTVSTAGQSQLVTPAASRLVTPHESFSGADRAQPAIDLVSTHVTHNTLNVGSHEEQEAT